MQKQGGHRGYTQTPRAQSTAPRCAFLDAMRATGIAPADPPAGQKITTKRISRAEFDAAMELQAPPEKRIGGPYDAPN